MKRDGQTMCSANRRASLELEHARHLSLLLSHFTSHTSFFSTFLHNHKRTKRQSTYTLLRSLCLLALRRRVARVKSRIRLCRRLVSSALAVLGRVRAQAILILGIFAREAEGRGRADWAGEGGRAHGTEGAEGAELEGHCGVLRAGVWLGGWRGSCCAVGVLGYVCLKIA